MVRRHRRSKTRTPSKIDADPLLAALFDLPAACVRLPSIDRGVGLEKVDAAYGTPPRGGWGGDRSGARRAAANPSGGGGAGGGDDGTDTSLLHGETISLTDEEFFSDAVATLAQEPSRRGGQAGRSRSTSPDNDNSTFLATRRTGAASSPKRSPASRAPGEAAPCVDSAAPPPGAGMRGGCRNAFAFTSPKQHHSAKFPVPVSGKCSNEYGSYGGGSDLETNTDHDSVSISSRKPLEEFVSYGCGEGPSSGTSTQHDRSLYKSPTKLISTKEKKERRSDEFETYRGGAAPSTEIDNQRHHVRLAPSDTLDEFVPYGRSMGSSSGSSAKHDSLENRSANKQSSLKKKKKRRSAAIKSLKKLVGRKSKSSSKVLKMASSFDDADSLESPPGMEPFSYVIDGGHSPRTPQDVLACDGLCSDRLSSLRSRIGRIRSTIQSLEGDLVITRNELAKANHQLHLATMELADVQRSALEADIGLSKLAKQQEGSSAQAPSMPGVRMSPSHFLEADLFTRSSSCSTSSDRLHYFTPTSSTGESDDDDSDCYTPRSRSSSHDSFVSADENGNIGSPYLDEAARGDVDGTPLTKNGKQRHKRHLQFESGKKLSNSLSSCLDVDTPSTAASTQEECDCHGKSEQDTERGHRSRRKPFFREESYIRTHDLSIPDESENLLLPLHKTDVSGVVNALFEKGYEFAMDESDRWSPELATGKILNKRSKEFAKEANGPTGQWPNAACGDEVLVWSSKCPHKGHGSEYPVVRSRGIIPTSARSLVDLLLDSGRVKQYNKMSLGRIDEHCFAMGVDKTTKIVRSKSQPPVIRKPVELRLLLHARRLPPEDGEGSKYLTIGRSVWETERGTAEGSDGLATRCEMLLSVNLIRDLQCADGGGWCEITTITHGVSPGIPISIGKRIGLAAAAKYIRDIRAVFAKQEV